MAIICYDTAIHTAVPKISVGIKHKSSKPSLTVLSAIMSLCYNLVASITCLFIQIIAALTSNEWHQNLELGKEYHYYTDCITEQSSMINKCIELGGTTMASIPSFNALKWFQNEFITESPSMTCTGNIAFGGIESGTLNPHWSWLNGDSWDNTIIPWDNDCESQRISNVSGSDHVLYMIYPSKLFCHASINNTYSIICERDIIPESPESNPTTLVHAASTNTNPAVFYLGAFIIICVIGIIFVGCILLFMLIGHQRRKSQIKKEKHLDNNEKEDKINDLELDQKPSMTVSPSEDFSDEGYQIPISRGSSPVYQSPDQSPVNNLYQVPISRVSSPKSTITITTLTDLKEPVPTLEHVPSNSIYPPGMQVLGADASGFMMDDVGSDSFSSNGEDSMTVMHNDIGEEKNVENDIGQEKNVEDVSTVPPLNVTKIFEVNTVDFNTADFIE